MGFDNIPIDDFRTFYRLTGRRRYRLLERIFRKPFLIVQVEIEANEMNFDTGSRQKKFKWRDARVEDFALDGAK